MKLNKVTVKDFDLKSKRVLMRVDFNVPIKNGEVTDDFRIQSALETIRYILEQGGKLILMSHLGRPKGKPDPSFSLAPAAKVLSKLLGKEVKMLNDCIGAEVEAAVNEMKEGDVVLLENLRFHEGEKKGDEDFAKKLANLADVYVDDAFATAHNKDASVAVVPKFLPSAVGFLMQKEIEHLGMLLESPEKPFVAILGGAKVSDKIKVITNLLERVDRLLIGGAMAYTFLHVQGKQIGNSLLDEEGIDTAKNILATAESKGVPIVLPVDHVVADKVDFDKKTLPEDATVKTTDGVDIPDGFMGLDIGPKTVELFLKQLVDAKTVVWNGPVGIFEIEQFAEGTKKVAETLAASRAKVVIGGGDTASAVRGLGLDSKMTHVSTGGGASLKFLEGEPLPGIEAIPDKE